MNDTPEGEASAKLAQHLVMAVQVAESIVRLRQQRTEAAAAMSETTAAGARAERTAQHAADRVVWSRSFDDSWLASADLDDLGRAWGAAAGWADTDPSADAAARRVEVRLSEMAPNAMARFDELRDTGWSRLDAMHDVVTGIAVENEYQPRVFVGEPSRRAAQDAQSRADSAAAIARTAEHTPDDPATLGVDEHADGATAAVSRRDAQAAWQTDADTLATDRQVDYIVDLIGRTPAAARSDQDPTEREAIAQLSRTDASAYITALGGSPSPRRVTAAGNPHAADVAADHHPRPFIDAHPARTTPPQLSAAAASRGKTRTLTR